MTGLNSDKRMPTMGHQSADGPANYRDASQSSQVQWTKAPTAIQIPATDVRRPAFRSHANPYRFGSGNSLDTNKRRPGNPNVNQTVLNVPPRAPGPSADYRAPKRPKIDNTFLSSTASNSASSWGTRQPVYRKAHETDIQEIEPPHLTNHRSDAVEVIDLQTSSDDLGEPIPRTVRSSSADPVNIPSKPATSKSVHAFDTYATEYSISASSKGKGRAEDSYDVVEGSEEDEEIEEFSSPSTSWRKSMAIPKNIVRELKTQYENKLPSPTATRRHIVKVNAVDLTTGRIVAKMKKKDGDVPDKSKSINMIDSVETSPSHFINSQREEDKTQVLPLTALCLGYHIFRRSKSAFATLTYESSKQQIKVSWGQPPEHIEFKLNEGIRSAMIVNESKGRLKENVLVQFTAGQSDKWKEMERKYEGFKGGEGRGTDNLTFLFSVVKDQGFTLTLYQQFVTAVRKAFAGSVEIITPGKGQVLWEFAVRHAEMFELTASRKGKGDPNETIADVPLIPRSATPCSSVSIKTRSSYPENPPREGPSTYTSLRRSERQSALGPSKEVSAAKLEPDEVVLMYPPTGVGALTVMQSDLKRLQPEEYLNDTLIEFGLKLWLNDLREKDPALADQIHVFSSFFYKKLNNRKNPGEGYKSVRKWTSKVPFFNKKYVFVPINENLHWYLAIIYEPGHTLEPPLPACQISKPRKTRRQTQKQGNSEADAETAAISEPMEVSPERSSPTAQVTEREHDEDVSSADATRVTTPSTTGNEEITMRAFNKACSITAESGSASAASSDIQMRDPSPVPDLFLPPPDSMDIVSINSNVSMSTPKISDDYERSASKPSSGVPVSRFYGSALKSEAAKPFVIVDNDDSGEDRQQEAEVVDMLAVSQSATTGLPQTYIFTLDSLGSRHPQAIKVLKEYLKAEAKDKRGFDEVRVAVGKQVQVPVQPNTWDCGIYLLHFVKAFMSSPSTFLEQILSSRGTIPSSERKKMWQDHEVAQFRDNMKSRIMQLSKEWKAEKVREEVVSRRGSGGIQEVETLSSEGEVDIVEDLPTVKATPGPKQKQRAMRLRG